MGKTLPNGKFIFQIPWLSPVCPEAAGHLWQDAQPEPGGQPQPFDWFSALEAGTEEKGAEQGES